MRGGNKWSYLIGEVKTCLLGIGCIYATQKTLDSKISLVYRRESTNKLINKTSNYIIGLLDNCNISTLDQ